jgi:hypothetical protein
VFTLMERELLAKMGRLLGGEYAAACDGLFVPGGSLSTIYSLLLARCAVNIICSCRPWARPLIARAHGIRLQVPGGA